MRWAFAVAFIAVLCAVLMQEFAAAESGTQQAVTSASSQAQQYSVAGQVLGADGIAVRGARISAAGAKTMSNDSGQFELRVAPGNQQLSIFATATLRFPLRYPLPKIPSSNSTSSRQLRVR